MCSAAGRRSPPRRIKALVRAGAFSIQCRRMGLLIPWNWAGSRRQHPERSMPTPRFWVLVLSALVLAGLFSTAVGADDHPVVALVKSKVKDPTKAFALLVPIKAKAGKGK